MLRVNFDIMKTKFYLCILPLLLIIKISTAQIVADISIAENGFSSNYGSYELQSGNMLHFRYYPLSNTMYAVKTNPNFHVISTVSNKFADDIYILPAKSLVKNDNVYMAMGIGAYMQTGSGLLMFDSNGVHVKSVLLAGSKIVEKRLSMFDWDENHIGISYVDYYKPGFNILKIHKSLNENLQQPAINLVKNDLPDTEILKVKSIVGLSYIYTAFLQKDSLNTLHLSLSATDINSFVVEFCIRWELPFNDFPIVVDDYSPYDIFLNQKFEMPVVGFKNYLFNYFISNINTPGSGFKILPDSLFITGLSHYVPGNNIIVNAANVNNESSNNVITVDFDLYKDYSISESFVSQNTIIGSSFASEHNYSEKFTISNISDCHEYLGEFVPPQSEYLSDYTPITYSMFNVIVSSLPPPQIQNAQSSVTYLCDVNHLAVDEEDDAVFQVFPNPASDWIYIKSEETFGKLKIIDLSGKLVGEFTYPQNSFHLGNLGNGVYFLRAESNQQTFVQKLIIARN